MTLQERKTQENRGMTSNICMLDYMFHGSSKHPDEVLFEYKFLSVDLTLLKFHKMEETIL